MFQIGERIRIRKGWEGAGRLGTVIGATVEVGQAWVPVKWDDADDPDQGCRVGDGGTA